MRAVLDTNVLISALVKGGKPRQLLNALLDPRHSLVITEDIVAEFSRVSSDEKIRKYASGDDVADFLRAFLSRAMFAVPESKPTTFGDADDSILAAAKAGAANVLVTGDRHLLELRRFGRTRIVTVSEALSILKGKRTTGRRASRAGSHL